MSREVEGSSPFSHPITSHGEGALFLLSSVGKSIRLLSGGSLVRVQQEEPSVKEVHEP